MRELFFSNGVCRFIGLLLSVLICAAFTACGRGESEAQERTAAQDNGATQEQTGGQEDTAVQKQTEISDNTAVQEQTEIPDSSGIQEKDDIQPSVTPTPAKDTSGDGTTDAAGDAGTDMVEIAQWAQKLKKSIEFSAPSGFYSDEFNLELSIPASDVGAGTGRIFYTLDGSDPAESDTAMEYTSAIRIGTAPAAGLTVSAVDPVLFSGNYSAVAPGGYFFESTVKAPSESAVDRCTVIRAAAMYDDGSFGPESGGVFFIGSPEKHIEGLAQSCAAAGRPLAVVSISVDYDDLFDSERGIYVKGSIFNNALHEYLLANGRIKDAEVARSLDANYKQHGREWEREASVSLLEVDADGAYEVISQLCGIRIQGNYSRSDLQKGFRLYARGDYGKKNFKYPVFGADSRDEAGQTMDKFDTLVLRAGGNCAFTAKFNDVYWQSLLGDLNCETQANRPCVVYINGEYWGLYVLQEDYSDDYFEDRYGMDKDSVVIYKGDAEKYACGYKLDEGKLPEGETEDYFFRELLDFFKDHDDLSADADYEEFCRIVDETSVMDYFAAEIWINNKWDWPGKNWSMWKAGRADGYDGRWRFMFYDMEFGGVSGSSDAKTNTVKEDNYKPEGLLDRGTNNPAVLCFAWLMTNKGFKERFCERLSGLSEGDLEQGAALAKLREYEDIYSPLYEQFFERYPGSGTADNAVSGGYASVKCIRDFLKSRKDNIGKMIDYINKLR